MKRNSESSRGGTVFNYLTRTGEKLWRYQFGGHPAEGRRTRISKGGFLTRGAALRALHLAVEEYDKPAAPPSVPEETLADWVQIWLRDYAPETCQPKTLERYHSLAAYVLKATDGEPAKLAATALAKVDHKAVEAALRFLLHAKAKRRKHLSVKTVHEIAGVLRVALNEAFHREMIVVNPFLRVKLPRRAKNEEHDEQAGTARSLTPAEIQKLRDACRGDWTATFVDLALASGARRGELLALTFRDVDFLNATLTISKSLEETRAGLRVKAPKSGKPRRVCVGQSVLAILRVQQTKQNECRRLCGEDYRANDLVFSQADGEYLRPDLVSQIIRRRMKKAGIQGASLHTLRHTHASTLLSKRIPLPAVSARLGHADANVTAKIYSHALPPDDTLAADAWETVGGPIQ